jgi:hypothetical protein
VWRRSSSRSLSESLPSVIEHPGSSNGERVEISVDEDAETVAAYVESRVMRTLETRTETMAALSRLAIQAAEAERLREALKAMIGEK